MATDILNPLEGHAEDAKLEKVQQMIIAILKEHDLCAELILCGRGRFYVSAHLEASWSMLRLVEDPNGDGLLLKINQADRIEHIAASACMARGLFDIHSDHVQEWGQASAYIDEQTGATHDRRLVAVQRGDTH